MQKNEAKEILDKYNTQINHLVEQRKFFIEYNAYLFAEFKIGEKVINKETLELGIVEAPYQYTYGNPNTVRFWEKFNIHCNIKLVNSKFESRNITANTSCYGDEHPWMKLSDWRER